MECPECGSEKIQRNGHYKNVQRYKCTNCGKSFRNNGRTYKSKNEKDFVQALYNLLNLNINSDKFEKFKLSKIISSDTNAQNTLDEISIVTKKIAPDYKSFSCINPKVVLCLSGNKIEIIYMPSNDMILPEYNKRTRFNLSKDLNKKTITLKKEKISKYL